MNIIRNRMLNMLILAFFGKVSRKNFIFHVRFTEQYFNCTIFLRHMVTPVTKRLFHSLFLNRIARRVS